MRRRLEKIRVRMGLEPERVDQYKRTTEWLWSIDRESCMIMKPEHDDVKENILETMAEVLKSQDSCLEAARGLWEEWNLDLSWIEEKAGRFKLWYARTNATCPERHGQWLAERIPGSELKIVEATGTSLWLDHRAEILEDLMERHDRR